jgi:5'-phosphate synthase pdxT subunit
MNDEKKIGVLALQGAFMEHIASFQKLGAEAVAIRLPREFGGLDGLVIPGGESTTISQLMRSCGLVKALRDLARHGFPVFGTCAGMILLAKSAFDSTVDTVGAMDIEVSRNAFGRQVDSFETFLSVPALGEVPFLGVFIRAPIIVGVGPGVEILASLPDGTPVAARQGNLLVSAFHPELTSDLRFHAYFLNIVSAYAEERGYRLDNQPREASGAPPPESQAIS